jgi:hypothetical protein
MLTPSSNIVYGSDKLGLVEGNPSFNAGAEKPSNPMFGDLVSASVSSPELHSIDPRLLLHVQALGEDRSSSVCHHQSSRLFLPMNALSEADNDLPNQMSCLNDSALTLREAEMTPNTAELSSDTLRYLKLWMLLNPGRLPSTTNLKSIENLSHAPGKGKVMMDWLKNQVTATSENNTSTNPRLAKLFQQRTEARQYRPKCVGSRQRKVQSSEPKLFACTYGCGQKFRLKGDWARHERANFEEWVCHVCAEGLTRKEHLRTHLKNSHDMHDIKLEEYKYELLSPINRPCGFCGKTFSSWWEWLAHVGAHFEGSIRKRTWKMSEWKERKMTAPGPGRRSKRSSGHHHNGGDDDDDDGDDGDDDSDAGDDDNNDNNNNNNDGTGANNGGGSALNYSYQASQTASGVGQGQPADHNFGSAYASFNRFSGDVTSQTYGSVQRTPVLRSTDQVKAPVDYAQEIVHGMAALEVSAAKTRRASDAYAQVSNYEPSLTNAKEHSHVRLYAVGISTRTVTVPFHERKRQIDSSTYRKGGGHATALSRWLDEEPFQEPWNSIARC